MSESVTKNAGATLELAHPGAITVSGRVSADGLKLFLECHRRNAEPGPITSFEELFGLLADHVPEPFLHRDVIHEIVALLNSGKEAPSRRVAKGLAPVEGRDGKLLLLVKPHKRTSTKSQAVEPRAIRLFDNIEAETTIARIYPPTEGKSGMDVLGETIPAQSGKPATVVIDEETVKRAPAKPGEPYEELIAKNAGYLEKFGAKLAVRRELLIEGDIDHRTGDIRFGGSVRICGNVMKNFLVHARENIIIEGNVSGGRLRTTNGRIKVTGSINGEETFTGSRITRNKTRTTNLRPEEVQSSDQVIAAKSVTVSILEGASINARGFIKILREAHNARIRTQTTLEMHAARFISGEIYVVCGVQAGVLGSSSGAETLEVHLCSDVEASGEFIDLNEAVDRHLKAEEMIQLLLGPFAEDPAAIRRLQPEYRQRMADLQAKLGRVRESRKELERQRTVMLETAKYNSSVCVNYEKMFQGVRLIAGEHQFTAENTLHGLGSVTFLPLEKTFTIGGPRRPACDKVALRSAEDNEI